MESLPLPVVVQLRDGTRVTLRPIRPDDAPRLQAFHTRLSPHSVYLRWLSAHPVLSDAEARSLSELDYRERMGFVATRPQGEKDFSGGEGSPGIEAIIGVARYSAVPGEGPGVAEAAVVVRDDYQQRGLGTLLIGQLLPYARAH